MVKKHNLKIQYTPYGKSNKHTKEIKIPEAMAAVFDKMRCS